MISDNIYDVNHRVPGAEEENRWLKIFNEGNRDLALDWLVRHNFRSIFKRAETFGRHPLFKREDTELHKDMIQEGIIGFIESLDRFEIERGLRLSTFSTPHIDMRIRKFLQTKTRIITIPIHAHNVITFFSQCRRANPKASLANLLVLWKFHAEEKKLSVKMDEDLIQVYLNMLNTTVLETEHNIENTEDGHVDGMFDTIPEKDENHKLCISTRNTIEECLAVLNSRDRNVIRWRFGLYGDMQTLEDIAEYLGVSRERVRQIQVEALKRLSKNPNIKLLYKEL